MGKIRNYLKTRGVGYYLTLPAIVFSIVAICLYCKNGITSFNRELNSRAIGYVVACIVLCVVSLVVDCKPIRYVAYLLCLYAFLWFIYSQVTYIANVFIAIDGYGFSGGFIATLVFYVLAFGFTLASAIADHAAPWRK